MAGPSTRTGAQTERKRKPGTRVQARSAFKGEGLALNADISDEDKKAKGTGFSASGGMEVSTSTFSPSCASLIVLVCQARLS